MRFSKRLSIITSIICLVILPCVIAFHGIDYLSLVYDISLAILGSALLGFVIALVQYYNDRHSSMENFYQEAMKAINKLGEAKYFSSDWPTGLIINAIAERIVNEHNITIGFQATYQYKCALIGYYKNDLPPEISNSPDPTKLVEGWYDNTTKEYIDELEECIDSYIRIADCHFNNLDNAFSALDFVFSNNTIRKKAYMNIYNPIKNLWKSIQRSAYHFRLYKQGKGSISLCTQLLLDLNNDWFLMNEVNNEDIHAISVYHRNYDSLHDELERFRCKIYKQEYQAKDHLPILSKILEIKHQSK